MILPRARAAASGKAPLGSALCAYLGAMRLVGPMAAPVILRRRLARGKEDPLRWPERLARAPVSRPRGALIWLHAVGLGETLALRGLITALAVRRPQASFLITSIARSAAEVMAANLPARTQHQFLPMDVPAYARAFLDAWRPDLSIWAEQDLWPAHLLEAEARAIPLALVNARMDDRARMDRARGGRAFGRLLSAFDLIGAQDARSAANLHALGARGVITHPSLKMVAPQLSVDPAALMALRGAVAGRQIWCLSSSHLADEVVALAAHRALWGDDPSALLAIVPRLPARGPEIAAGLAKHGIAHSLASRDGLPRAGDAVHVDDAFGRLGLWYRLAPTALLGGSFGPVEGHNPWEALHLGAAVLHGPRTANFAGDYDALDAAGAACPVLDAAEIATALRRDLSAQRGRADGLLADAARHVDGLADHLVAMLPPTEATAGS